MAEEDSDSCSSSSSGVSSTSSLSSLSSSSSSSSSDSDKTFRLEELRFALYHMPDSSKVGPDGFSVLFYKTFFDHLGPPLLRVLEEAFVKVGDTEAEGAKTTDFLRSGLASRELVSVPKERKKVISLRGSIQKALRLSQDDVSVPGNDGGSSTLSPTACSPTASTSSTTSPTASTSAATPPSTVSASVKSRPAITRQLRAMSLHPEVDYVLFSPPSSASSSARKSYEGDTGVVILNADARLLFRVNWNHAVFATPRETVKPHARLLFEQLRGPAPRVDEALDRLLAFQIKKEVGCDVLIDVTPDGTNRETNLNLDTDVDDEMSDNLETAGDNAGLYTNEGGVLSESSFE